MPVTRITIARGLHRRSLVFVANGWAAMTTTVSSSPKKECENPQLGSVDLRFRSILVATDCSPTSEIAVKLAARLAKEFHARLYVLHSILPELCVFDMCGPVPELGQVDLQRARENPHKYVQHIPDLRTVKHQKRVSLGPASEAIQSAAESNGIDLLVLGSHGRHGLAKLNIGSVAEWAIRRLSYPVLVAGPMFRAGVAYRVIAQAPCPAFTLRSGSKTKRNGNYREFSGAQIGSSYSA